MPQRRFLTALAAAAIALAGFAVPAQAAEPAFQVPFPCGERWHGDNPGSSEHETEWEIDFNWGTGSDDLGKPVVAAASGTVVTAAYQTENGYGKLVKIRHSGDYHTYYAHLKDMEVQAGDTVSQGELIGYVGNTSATDPGIKPHLHYEVRLGTAWPSGIVPANFNGTRFPYPSGYVTSQNCGVRAAKSINGDKYDDAIGIDSTGTAFVYHGQADGGLGGRRELGPGWSPYERVAIGDSNADGYADLFATDGTGLYYWNNSRGSFTFKGQVGTGWSAVDHFSVADVNGDNKADILARDGSTMRLYIGEGNGGFASPTVVGTGWTAYPRHTAADADGDGDGDIWATNADGELYFWRRSGSGYASAVQVGNGWANFPQMTSMDINGDGKADLIAIRSDNTLWQWLGSGDGTFATGTQIGHGWAGFRLALY